MGKARLFSQLIAGNGTIKAAKLGADVPITENVATADNLPSSASMGEQAFVEDTNRLYIWNGSGWYNIALINTSPTWDSNGQPATSYVLDTDSPQDATVITLAASDPEGLPITYSYVIGGSMDSMATISQDSSVFTITPKTVSEVGEGVELTGSITFRASDGVNILPSVSSFTLRFVTVIENSKYTTLLVTAVDTSDNNNITDSSTNNHTITVNGDASAGTFSPYRHGGYSAYFDGTDDCLEVSGVDLSSGSERTIDFWYYKNGTSTAVEGIFGIGNPYSNSEGISLWTRNGDWELRFGQTIVYDSAADGSLVDFTWHHIAIVITTGNNAVLWIDGVLKYNSYGSATVPRSSSMPITIGSTLANVTWNGTFSQNCYIHDFMIYNTAKYNVSDNTISVPTESLSTSGTELAVCHLPYFADGSSNGHSITVRDNASTKPFTPYENLEYTAADNGGSVYLGASSSYLYAPTGEVALGSGDFTAEVWLYPNSVQSGIYGGNIMDWRSGGNAYANIPTWILTNAIAMEWRHNAGASALISASSNLTYNAWNHCVVERSGTTITMYLNGKSVGSVTNNSDNLTVQRFRINDSQGSYATFGYFSDTRITIGSAVYGSEFTPPTAPLSSTGSTLHVKGTDASIIDKSQGSNLKLVGNTTGSTTEVKFAGTKSIYFNPSATSLTNYIDVSNVDGNFGTGDFTIEGWIRPASIDTSYSTSSNSPILDLDASSGTGANWWVVHQTGSSIQFGTNQAIQHSGASSSLTADTWHHFAVARENGTIRIFVDGSETGASVSYSTAIGSTRTLRLAGQGGSSRWWEGYMSDLRITKGLARYTANFTPPTASLEG